MNKQTFILTASFALCALMIFGLGAVIRAAESSLPTPVQLVMTPYIQIHDALAKDSLDGVAAAATNLSKAAQGDKLFPNEFVQEAQTLAQAKDLDAARAAFKPLSETLIKVMSDNNIKFDPYAEAYCPMVNAHWLQTGTTVSNPFGASMSHCGSLVGSKPVSTTTTCPMSGGCCN